MPLLMGENMQIARYTRAEALRLEDIYIDGYKREGLWGRGKTPANDKRPTFCLTPAGEKRQRERDERRAQTFKLLKDGYTTARAVCDVTGWSDTSARLYFRHLEKIGLAEIDYIDVNGKVTWKLK